MRLRPCRLSVRRSLGLETALWGHSPVQERNAVWSGVVASALPPVDSRCFRYTETVFRKHRQPKTTERIRQGGAAPHGQGRGWVRAGSGRRCGVCGLGVRRRRRLRTRQRVGCCVSSVPAGIRGAGLGPGCSGSGARARVHGFGVLGLRCSGPGGSGSGCSGPGCGFSSRSLRQRCRPRPRGAPGSPDRRSPGRRATSGPTPTRR